MRKDSSLSGKNLYRVNYKMVALENESTRLFIASSMQEVCEEVCRYSISKFSVELVEGDISLDVLTKELV